MSFPLSAISSEMESSAPLSSTSRRSRRLDPSRHRFHTKFSFILTIATLILLSGLSVFYRSSPSGDTRGRPSTSSVVKNRWLDQSNDVEAQYDDAIGEEGDADYSGFSCRYIYDQVPEPGAAQCQFAQTCNGGEGVWAPWVFCSSWLSVISLFAILSPVMILWMVTLFRLLGSTAEDFFSPSLEMFSLKLGLPPRFAGVTLLALGNGAADVSATMSAIVNDQENGYNLSLGALSGAAMLVGCVVSGLVILVAEGVPCRGALMRDVTALAVTVAVVWSQLAKGVVTPGTITLFLSLYGFFVILVLVADVYHRAVVLPRLQAAAALLAAEQAAAAASGLPIPAVPLVPDPPNAFMRFMTAFSNYDISCQNDTTDPQHGSFNGIGGGGSGEMMVGQENLVAEDGMVGIQAPPPPQLGIHPHQRQAAISPISFSADVPIVLHGQHGILHGDGQVPSTAVDSNAEAGAYTLVDDHMDQICTGAGTLGTPSTSWKGAWRDGQVEVSASVIELWDDAALNGDLKFYEKFLLVCEFPFTLVRKATIPIPCEGYYNRGFIALSMVLSPFWFAFYMLGHEMNMLSKSFLPYFLIYWGVCTLIGALILRYASGGEGNIVLIAATPVALYGFVMAATWIDFIANHLVSLLDFMGIVLHIPGTVMGLTVLAWGNSMGDLSANMTMARKGLANMAMTACFAGPVFNILMGLGLGFGSLARQTGNQESSVSLSSPVLTGFVFVVVNCVSILLVGVLVGNGRIEPYYGYVAVGLYAVYIITSITLQINE